MTIVAGLMSRNGRPIPKGLRDALISVMSRNPHDSVRTYGGDYWLIAKIDIGALGGEACFSTPGGPAFVLAGEMLVRDKGFDTCLDREVESKAVFEELCNGDVSSLQCVSGQFCAAMFLPADHRLILVSDKLGLRPVYYTVNREIAAFASALRVLEVLGLGTDELDLRGAYEASTFGYPLNSRTCYSHIHTIAPAEVVHITRDAETHAPYFHWDELELRQSHEDSLVPELVHAFEDGVKRRSHGDKRTISFLSGGLDSRAIVAALRKQKITVYSVNFAPPGSQDRAFGALAAGVLGSVHHVLDVPRSTSRDIYRKQQIKAWIESTPWLDQKPERPYCIWSGDGGSVALGHVYVDQHAARAFDNGDMEQGIQEFLRYNRILGGGNSAMTPAFRNQCQGWHIHGIREEIEFLQRKLDGRSLHLFLMLNDQRRHLADHFENIDVDRFEFQLPFFDSHFLELILREPVSPFLRHVLYHKWIRTLSPDAASVPWQVYPTHEPCPVSSDAHLRYQWGDYYGRRENRRIARRMAIRALGDLFAPNLPRHLIRRSHYGAAILLSLAGVTGLGHIIRTGNVFSRCWRIGQRRSSERLKINK